MASAFRSLASGGFGSGAGPTLSISKPAGTIDGDVLIATFLANNSGAISPPSGWTPVFNNILTFTKRRTQYFRIAAGEPASYSWSSAADACAGVIVCVSGTTGAMDTQAHQTNAASATVTGPAFTTAQANETIVWAGFRDDTSGGGSTDVHSPTNLTLRTTVYGGGSIGNPALWIATGQFASAGALTNAEKNGSIEAAFANAAAIIAFLPGAAPVVGTPSGSMFLGSI